MIDPDTKAKQFHQVLKAVFATFIARQQKGGYENLDIELGEHQGVVDVLIACSMTLGDMQGGDKHTGPCTCYGVGMKHLCCQCNVQGEESGDPLIQ